MQKKHLYTARWQGEDYTLALRQAEDGFIPMWLRDAVQTLIEGYVQLNLAALPPRMTNALLDMIVEGADRGIIRKGREFVPIPWASWTDLPAELIDEVIEDFFVLSLGKLRNCENSGRYTIQERALRRIYDARTVLNFASPSKPKTSRSSSTRSTTSANSD